MIVLDMSMSLDGFVVGPDDSVEEPMGRGGFRLFNWLDDRDSDGPSGQVYREAMTTRALIAGRRTFEHAGRWNGDHHDGVPMFILTHHVDEGDVPPGTAVFVTDVAEAAARAKEAAGDRNVLVHGAGAGQALLKAGLVDEIEVHLVNVLLGQGRRFFDNLPAEYIELEPIRQLVDRDVTHLRYRVVR
ncbi:dihydrofolate reductase family protein [Kribbella sp. NPDC051952]|uniref:dihydrofolate reductase family protein n=1 Tax=Kribbella sp. NPDC051952 TaxID=3154851 RepID=UPI00344545FC